MSPDPLGSMQLVDRGPSAPELTIFACPKPFTDPHIAMIQRNALTSWTLLRPRPQIIIFGDESGSAEICRELGLRHVPEIARTSEGTPLVSDIFSRGQQLATTRLVCYVNADIILTSDVNRALPHLLAYRRPFLAIGRRWNVDVRSPISFDSDWESKLKMLVRSQGTLYVPNGLDYFLFTRGVYGSIPPFALGRNFWDIWLVYEARRQVDLVDASQAILAVHQNHDYSHIGIPGAQYDDVGKTPEHCRNGRLTHERVRLFSTDDATHVLTPRELRRVLFLRRLRRVPVTGPALYPGLSPILRMVTIFQRSLRLALAALRWIRRSTRRHPQPMPRANPGELAGED